MDRTKTLQDKITQEDLEVIFKCLPANINDNEIARGELIGFVSRITSLPDSQVPPNVKNEIRATNIFKNNTSSNELKIDFSQLSHLCANQISYQEGLPNLIKFIDNNGDVNKVFKFLENVLPEFPSFIENTFVNNGNSISTSTMLNAICTAMKHKFKEFEGKKVPPIISNNLFTLDVSIKDFSKTAGIFNCVSKADPNHFSVADFINQVYVSLSNQKGFLDWLDKNPEIKKQVEFPAPKAYTTNYSATINTEVFIKPEVIAHQLDLTLPLAKNGCALLVDYITKDLYLPTLLPVKNEKFTTHFKFSENITEFSSFNGKPINSERIDNEANQVKEIFKLAEHFNNPVAKNLINQYAKASFPDKELRGKAINALKACQFENQILTKIQEVADKQKDEPTTSLNTSFKL